MFIYCFNLGSQLHLFVCVRIRGRWWNSSVLKMKRAKSVFSCCCCLLINPGAGFGMGSRSATTSPTGSLHSTPTHQTKPNTLDPFADIGNLGGSLGGQALEIFRTTWLFVIFTTICCVIISVLYFIRFWLLEQTHHTYWNHTFHPSHGFPIATSSISPARRRVAVPCRGRLPLMAARCWRRWRMATPRTGPCLAAKAQPQPHPHVSHIAPEPTQLQCQFLCNGWGLAQRRRQSTGWHGWAGDVELDFVLSVKCCGQVVNLQNSRRRDMVYINYHNSSKQHLDGASLLSGPAKKAA